jgi:trans-aconitate 2-methyltransferase
MARDWDAPTYDRVSEPMYRWGGTVLDRLELAGTERVLDAGCGSGRVTQHLLERLPDGHVVALDASPSMLAEARERLAPFGDRVEFVLADLAAPLPVTDPVDAILSTATFHWVADHDALFHHLAAVLRRGGALRAQCGGAGNIDAVLDVLRQTGDGWVGPWTYATPEDTTGRLAAAGFVDVECWLHDEPTTFEDDDDAFATFLRTVILGAHLDRLPEPEREPFVAAVAAGLPSRTIDYVRLNINARRA